MKKLIWLIVATILATATQATAQNRRQEQADPNRKTSYVDQRLVKLLVDSVTAMNQEQLQGSWKLVLVGPTEDTIGRYDSNGIPNSDGKILTFSVSSTSSSWLPQSVSRQIVVIPSSDMKVYFDIVAKANEPAAAVMEGNFLILKSSNKSIKCGFVNAHADHLICVHSQKASSDPGIYGFERIISAEKQ